jgi:hypothetical protein
MGEPVKSPRNLQLRPLRLLLALVALLLAPTAQAAPDSASCTVRIIHAKHDGKEFDARLEPLHKQLTGGPLSVWKSFKLLDQPELQVQAAGAATEFPVPGNHKGTLAFVTKVDAPDQKVPRLRLRLQILDGQATLVNTTFLLNNKGNLLIGGIDHEGGKLILGITCKLNS